MTERTLVMLLLVGTGVLFWALGRGMRTVRPNPLYGVRIGATFADERVWRDANRRSGDFLAWLGLGLSVSTLAAWLIVPGMAGLLVVLGAMTAGTLWMSVDAERYANARLAFYRALDADASREG